MTNKQFAAKYEAIAIKACKDSGVFPETAIAQAIVEKGGKESPDNNFFNINATDSWKGKKTTVQKDWKLDKKGNKVYYSIQFRAYDSPQEAFNDYVNFLKSNARYKKAGVFDAKNYKEQIAAIAKAGYAASPTYAKNTTKIADIIDDTVDGIIDGTKAAVNVAKNNPLLTIVVVLIVVGAIIALSTNQI